MDAGLLDESLAWAKTQETARPKDLSDQVRDAQAEVNMTNDPRRPPGFGRLPEACHGPFIPPFFCRCF
jgi:hypothetical protein